MVSRGILDPTPGGRSDDRVLLCMANGRDRELLRTWLDGTYEVTTADPDEESGAGSRLPADYDLCIVDHAAFESFRDAIEARREAVDPVFLPCILLVPEGRDAGAELAAGSTVDDVTTLPVEQRVLGRRIENLLEARRASVRLAEREEQYHQLVELTPEGILILRDGAITYANSAAREMLGIAETGEIGGRDVTEFVPEVEQSRLAGIVEAVEGQGRLGEFRNLGMRTEDGDTVETEVAGVTVTYEGAPAVQLVLRDVTAERERRQRLDLFGRAIETAAQGITIADARQDDDPLVYANAAFERITGYDAAEVLGRNCRFLQGEKTDERTVAQVSEALHARKPVAVEILNYRKDGTPFWNRLEIVPVRDEDGEVTHFLGLQQDVTERKERRERLEVLDRVLRHNIRNRVNVILGYAESIREATTGELNREATEVVAAAEELLGVSERLREFQSIISAENRSLEVLDLVAILERLVEGAKATHPDADIEFEAPEEALVEAHRTLPDAFRQSFELAMAEAEGTALSIRIAVEGDDVVLEVLDRGGTLEVADLRALSEGTETPLEHSEGLEMWLTRWAILYSGGEVQVEESESRFRIEFPRADAGE